MNEFDKVLPVDQPALEEQHNNIVGQGDGVVVELEGVGVGKGDGEYREKILCIESFNTFEIDMRMERNSRTGIVMWTVEDILDRFSKGGGCTWSQTSAKCRLSEQT